MKLQIASANTARRRGTGHIHLRQSCAAFLLLAFIGCKSAPPATDAGTLGAIQTQLSGDSSLSGQPIQTSVQNGVATLTGTVSNDAQRTIAARDAAGVAGVKEVVNNLSIVVPSPASAAAIVAPVAPIPVPTKRTSALVEPSRPDIRNQRDHRDANNQRQPAPIERPQQPGNQAQGTNAQQPYNPPPAQPQAPAPPTFRTVTIPSGDTFPVRITQTLDSATTQTGDSFSGVLASDILIDGLVALPSGSPVSGRVDAVQEAGHFKGASLLTVSLVSVSRRGGERVTVGTEPYTVDGKGRGKNTAEKVGGGAAVGAVLGGIFGGGKGAAIGAAAGGGLGAGSQAITRGQQVQIPSESVVRFRLASPVTVRVRSDAGNRSPDNADPTLLRHTN